jgi:hypothetical protein
VVGVTERAQTTWYLVPVRLVMSLSRRARYLWARSSVPAVTVLMVLDWYCSRCATDGGAATAIAARTSLRTSP